MDDKTRCQSCGMPLGEGFFGTEMNGRESKDYCKFCYKKGTFSAPGLTLQGMIDNSVFYMTTQLNIPEDKTRAMSRSLIPYLKRWKQ